jgi:hypothetical protein
MTIAEKTQRLDELVGPHVWRIDREALDDYWEISIGINHGERGRIGNATTHDHDLSVALDDAILIAEILAAGASPDKGGE